MPTKAGLALAVLLTGCSSTYWQRSADREAARLIREKTPLVPKNVPWFTVRGQDFSNPEIDALLEKGRTTIGLNDRKALYDQVQDKLLKELNPRVWHAWSTTVIMLRPDLRGFRAHPSITAGNVILAGTWRAKKK